MRSAKVILATAVCAVMIPAASAHELWCHLKPGADSRVVRLTFGDGPDLNEAD
jgi:hypothetical protein